MLKVRFWFLGLTVLLFAGQYAFGCFPTNETDRSGVDCSDSDCSYSCDGGSPSPNLSVIPSPVYVGPREDSLRMLASIPPDTLWRALVPRTVTVADTSWMGDTRSSTLSLLLSGHLSAFERRGNRRPALEAF